MDSCKSLNFSPPDLAESCFFPFLFTTYICESAMGWDKRLIHLGGNQATRPGQRWEVLNCIAGSAKQIRKHLWEKRFCKTTIRNPMSPSITFKTAFGFVSKAIAPVVAVVFQGWVLLASCHVVWQSARLQQRRTNTAIASRREKNTKKQQHIFTLNLTLQNMIEAQNAHKATCITKIGSYS